MISDAGEMWLVEGLSDLDAQTRFNASCLLSIHFARLEECLHRYIGQSSSPTPHLPSFNHL